MQIKQTQAIAVDSICSGEFLDLIIRLYTKTKINIDNPSKNALKSFSWLDIRGSP